MRVLLGLLGIVVSLQPLACTSVGLDVPAPVLLRMANVEVRDEDSALPPVHFEYWTMWYERQVMFVFERGPDGSVRRISFETSSDASEALATLVDVGRLARPSIIPP